MQMAIGQINQAELFRRCEMPVYEFECKACKKLFSLVMPVIEAGKRKISCPHCDHTKIRNVISVVSVVTAKKS